MLALLRDEPAGTVVEAAIERGGAVMSWINLGEVLYIESRRVGEDRALRATRAVERAVRVETPDRELVVDAARLKARGRISYADCFALAVAARHGAPLLTGDGEIVHSAGQIEVVDLRRSSG